MRRYAWGLALVAGTAWAEPAGQEGEILRALEAAKAEATPAEEACLELPLAEARELLAMAERIGGAQQQAQSAGDAARSGTLGRQLAVVTGRAREALVEAALCLGPKVACRLLGEACPEGETLVWVDGYGAETVEELDEPWEPPIVVVGDPSPFQ